MLIHKFGGTSLANSERLQTVADIILESSKNSKTAVVLSAMGKTTDELISIMEMAKCGDDWKHHLQILENNHQQILVQLNCACAFEAQRQLTSINYLFREAEAKYNMYKMYQKIMRSGKSGGLFRSKSWSSVEERNFFKDSFTVSWDDSENTLSQADKDAREQEMRRSVLSRLATIALPTVPNRAEILNAGDPPTRGAIVVSDELMKTCPSNVYCVAGAAVMRVLDAIFGNSTSTANYTNIQDITVTEKYNNKQKITKSWITSYLKL